MDRRLVRSLSIPGRWHGNAMVRRALANSYDSLGADDAGTLSTMVLSARRNSDLVPRWEGCGQTMCIVNADLKLALDVFNGDEPATVARRVVDNVSTICVRSTPREKWKGSLILYWRPREGRAYMFLLKLADFKLGDPDPEARRRRTFLFESGRKSSLWNFTANGLLGIVIAILQQNLNTQTRYVKEMYSGAWTHNFKCCSHLLKTRTLSLN